MVCAALRLLGRGWNSCQLDCGAVRNSMRGEAVMLSKKRQDGISAGKRSESVDSMLQT